MRRTTITRSYSELRRLPTFFERFEYLKLDGVVGEETFGMDRIFNQIFYTSKEWRSTRDRIISRDNGCDLGIEGFELTSGGILVHHINPISILDIENESDALFDPENLICTSRFTTHNAIHYGDVSLLPTGPVERRPNDMCPWRR